MTTEPTKRVLSLGAGVQSTVLALMTADGTLPRIDAAIFADTGWEPKAVYDHLARLKTVLDDAGIPLVKVGTRNLRDDTVNGPYLRLPVFVEGGDGRASMLRRQCTERYKMEPIRRHIKLLLGAKQSRSGSILHPPAGAVAEQWIGFSVDEIGRVNDSNTPAYLRNAYPLLDLHMSRSNCIAWLERRGWGSTPKSACISCPFHGNRMWRELRDKQPDEWAQAVADDEAMRAVSYKGLKGVPFLHRSLLPLAQAPIDRVQRKDAAADAGDLFDFMEEGEPDGCSPYGCRSGSAA
ncbi:hypothetical protein OOJ91_12095 [Micromonospora lupini]|uniref:hypothetical protein n=1 Tax=Micromonospora lupini TaxID=285679 RepID=UPI002252AED8|nr:hypothetical protein [Micromonospora lupini]MCX5066619.1 hypothetical protein [Micromonospora lupini]